MGPMATMLAEERRLRIQEILASQRSVTASELKDLFRVTPATIRRDLAVLEDEGILVRSHGGAVLRTSSTSFQPSYDVQMRINRLEKQMIAAEAERYISDGETVFFEGSTTVYELARRLTRRARLTVVTNSPAIVSQLHDCPGVTIIAIGGQLQRDNLYISGPWAERTLEEIRLDKAILGVTAIDTAYGMSTARLGEAEIKRRLIKVARQRIALADHTKFGKQCFAYVGPVKDVDVIITDGSTDPKYIQELRDMGVEVVVAGRESAHATIKNENNQT